MRRTQRAERSFSGLGPLRKVGNRRLALSDGRDCPAVSKSFRRYRLHLAVSVLILGCFAWAARSFRTGKPSLARS